MQFRFLSAGESHGKKLTAVIDGVPAGFEIDLEKIDAELARRQKGYGRGGRMRIETDKAEITAGVRLGKTIGSPIAVEIINIDHEKWLDAMSVAPIPDAENVDLKSITKLRPGHADYAGAVKYNQNDVRNILERSSARETAIRVAIGAIAKQILEKFGINISSKVISIGSVSAEIIDGDCNNDLNCPDDAAYERMKKEIDRASEKGVTLGGQILITAKGVPAGLGSHVHWDKKLDGLLAQALMSIQAVKAVEIGLGTECAFLSGDKVHDEIFYIDGKICRNTNNAGGIEGGISNGEDIVLKISMKPIPTMKTPLKSIDLIEKTEQQAHFERSDTCAVPACGVVAESMCAIIILQQFLAKFGGDSVSEITANYENYMRQLR